MEEVLIKRLGGSHCPSTDTSNNGAWGLFLSKEVAVLVVIIRE